MRLIDISGARFGRLLVERRLPQSGGEAMWVCRCDCGGTAISGGSALRRGATQSCGCLHREQVGAINRTHGARRGRRFTREYLIWQHMKRRCYTPTDKAFSDYGGRGITVCDEWREDFAAFLRDMGHCPPDHSIERINNDGPYSPQNCRWATRREQNSNTRRNRYINVNGEALTVSEAARRAGIKPALAHCRTHRGDDPLSPRSKRNGTTLTCVVCGETFYVPKARIATASTCSLRCASRKRFL